MKKNVLLFFPALVLFYGGFSFKAVSVSSTEVSALNSSTKNQKPAVLPSQKELLKMNKNISPTVIAKIKTFIQNRLSDVKNNAQLLALLAKMGINNKELIGESLNQAFNGGNTQALDQLLNQIQQNPEIQRQIQSSPGYKAIEKQIKGIFSEMEKSIDNF